MARCRGALKFSTSYSESWAEARQRAGNKKTEGNEERERKGTTGQRCATDENRMKYEAGRDCSGPTRYYIRKETPQSKRGVFVQLAGRTSRVYTPAKSWSLVLNSAKMVAASRPYCCEKASKQGGQGRSAKATSEGGAKATRQSSPGRI